MLGVKECLSLAMAFGKLRSGGCCEHRMETSVNRESTNGSSQLTESSIILSGEKRKECHAFSIPVRARSQAPAAEIRSY